MELAYVLIPGGYSIQSADGRIRIIQKFSPDRPGFEPMTPEEAEASAKALIAEILANSQESDTPDQA
ncbi:hypothetical protein [Comamonas terrigena]|uniref:hypothetical protein n=1 Tax=Comamonas terrigena TaxID=32013 RepID=UPI00289A3206|nr:hypothetical protein [Comamonas terrigena]